MISWRTCQVINYRRCTADSPFWFWFSDIGFWFSILVFGSLFWFLVLHYNWFLVLHFAVFLIWFSILAFGSPFWFWSSSPFWFLVLDFSFWLSIWILVLQSFWFLVLQFVGFLVLHFGFWFSLQIGTVMQDFDMRPYLDLLHHLLVMEHSWQAHRIKVCFVGECMVHLHITM